MTTPPRPEPFDAADTAFRLLCAGPQPLALHAAKVAAGLPDRPVPLDELRVLLLHPSTSARARNQVWAELVRRARAGDPAWTVGLAGIAMPGLRRAAGSLAAAYRGDPADLQAEVLTGFLAAVRALDPDDLEAVPLASRLCWAAWRAGQQHAYADAGWCRPPPRPRRAGATARTCPGATRTSCSPPPSARGSSPAPRPRSSAGTGSKASRCRRSPPRPGSAIPPSATGGKRPRKPSPTPSRTDFPRTNSGRPVKKGAGIRISVGARVPRPGTAIPGRAARPAGRRRSR